MKQQTIALLVSVGIAVMVGGFIGWKLSQSEKNELLVVPTSSVPAQRDLARDPVTKTTPSTTTTESESEKVDLSGYRFALSGTAIGSTVGNETGNNLLMADAIRLPDGTYRMYYNFGGKGTGSIKYADSATGTSEWKVGGTALNGGSNATDDDYIIGGSRVIILQDGTYRMYYRATPDYSSGEAPSYSIYMAESTDGKTFTKYGVVIPNTREDAESTLVLAGHGAFYQMADGTFGAIFSGNSVSSTSAPSDLFFATSTDGIEWNTPKVLYKKFHDPTIFKTSEGYFVIGMSLKESVGIAYSKDGTSWSTEMTEIQLTDESGADIDLMSIGDLSATVGSDGSILLFSNYENSGKRVIASYTQQ